MDIVTAIQERLASDPRGEGVLTGLLSRAAGAISTLRQAYEPKGAIDPWTGEWVKDGVVSKPAATHDAAGRPVTPQTPVTGAVEGPPVATHAIDHRGIAVPVADPAVAESHARGPNAQGRTAAAATPAESDQGIQESHGRSPNARGPQTPTVQATDAAVPADEIVPEPKAKR